MTLARGLAAIALAIAAARSPASADLLRATRSQQVDEISHTVLVRISDGVATYTVQRQFQNRGKIADEAHLSISLPTGAAATGLRIRASGTWHTGELLDRDVAAARYQELTGAGVYDPKDPALLYWISSSELYLQVFPVLPGAVSTVEYTLTVPTRYAAGRYWLTYPRVDPASQKTWPGARKLVDPVVAIEPGWAPGRGGIAIDGKAAEPGKPVALAPHARDPWRSRATATAYNDLGYDSPDLESPYATSTIDVPAASGPELRYSLGKLRVELLHPLTSTLELALVTPAGDVVEVVDNIEDARDGRVTHDVRFPEAVRALGRWRLLVRSRATDETGALLRWSLAFGDRAFASAGPPAFIPSQADARQLAVLDVAAPPATAWSGRLGRVVASDAHAFTRFELDTAARVSELPKRAQVVFVLDASYSAGPEHLAAQLAIVRGYVAHVPDAELEVIAVRRTAKRVFGRFVSAAEAPRLLDAAVRGGTLALGNGSALDEGARLAASLLAGRAGPQRVVLATDELLRASLTQAQALAALAALAPAAVVHVVVPRLDATAALPALERDDNADLAALAAGHHGILARISGFPAPQAELRPVVLELVRPTRIEHVALSGTTQLSIGDVLREGEGLRLWDDTRAAAAPSSLTLTGKLWSDPIRLDLAASPGFSTQAAAFVFGADQHGNLSEAEQRTVALAGRAVSPVTSYLAIEPGVRPMKIGFDDGPGGGGGGWGSIGAGHYGTLGCGSGGSAEKLDLASLIPTQACVRKHAPDRAWSVKLSVETTKDEIVDVTVDGDLDPLAACLVEAAWAVRLPDAFSRYSRTYSFELSDR
ncbi:MAG TPA: VIT domain-containing protein [Kofleriaceae bacterium]|nr:VIT domain-containing protein [Kofleriaceae bacterium]